MAQKKPSPLQASFWISSQEKVYLLVICALFLIGLGARYFYLNNRAAVPAEGPDLDKVEEYHE